MLINTNLVTRDIIGNCIKIGDMVIVICHFKKIKIGKIKSIKYTKGYTSVCEVELNNKQGDIIKVKNSNLIIITQTYNEIEYFKKIAEDTIPQLAPLITIKHN